MRAYTSDGDAVVAWGPFALKLLAAAAAAQRVLDLTAETWQRGIEQGVDGLGAADEAP